MTTNTSINISKSNIYGNCDLKCAYNFKYPETNITARNNGIMIDFRFDTSSESAVVYNQKKYSVGEMVLLSPSIHIFNGATTNAELIITHTPVLGGNQLLVCIPITQSSDSNAASNLVTELIQSVSNNAPAPNESTTINISGFTLNSIVPKRPFYSYAGTSDNTDYIVYDILDAISLSSSTLTSLSQIIKPFPLPTTGGNLFYNKLGPNQTAIGDGIYISCNPTGSSEEEEEVEYSKNSTEAFDFSNPIFKTIIQIFFSCLIFIVIFYLLSDGYSFMTGTELSTPKMKFTNPFKKTN